eukprot:TRINITY_DN1882_c0_g1_i3.p1 TRINITY_DN1882_c0_g1~~TRINITY_DN1882_c0_g1_i3.p1  ORF type:complete len:213 (+),score=78.83 TRINITY_DN1882_c0_g1_i3:149-787(+)
MDSQKLTTSKGIALFSLSLLSFIGIYSLFQYQRKKNQSLSINQIQKGIEDEKKKNDNNNDSDQKEKESNMKWFPKEIKIFFSNNWEETESLCMKLHQLLKERNEMEKEIPAIGLDIEWKPHTLEVRSKTATLQISDGFSCFVFHLFHFEREDLPPSLIQILQDPNILKFGVGIHQDARMILSDYKVPLSSTVELSAIAVRYSKNRNTSCIQL